MPETLKRVATEDGGTSPVSGEKLRDSLELSDGTLVALEIEGNWVDT
jgi:biotin operon repressor